jgi:hypothetical protein
MCPSKYIFFILLFFLPGVACLSQEKPVQDSLLIIDSVHDAIEQDDDDEEYQSTPFSASRHFYNIDTVTFRSVSDSVSLALKKQKSFEYANDPEYWKKEKLESMLPRENFMDKLVRFFMRPAVRTFIFLLLIALAIFVIIKVIIINKLYVFSSSAKKAKSKDAENESELINENLDEKINDALARNDQRSAVRYLYLKTLQLLDRKGWIRLHSQATNFAYRNQVNQFAKGKEFGFLSSVYEHVWYGNFKLSPQQFDIVIRNFTHFQSVLKV